MPSQEDDQNSGLPQDFLDKISGYLKNDPDKLVLVLTFLTDHENQTTKRYLQVLRSVYNNDDAFEKIVDKLAQDTQTLKSDPSYIRLMADIWNNYLKPNEKKNVGDGQRFDFDLILSNNNNLIKTTAAYNFISALSKLDPTIQSQVIQLIINTAETTVGTNLALTLNNNFKNLLQVTKSTSGKIVSVSLVTVYLTYEAITNLKLWWRGEISGKRCSKNMIDSFAGMAAGVGGGIVGASVGSSIVTGFGLAIGTFVASMPIAMGSIIGAVIGGVTLATAATKGSDWLTQKIFNLPKGAALENAYKFLGLEYGASNDEINSSFRQLALKYHPDKGGNYDDWHTLQYCMAVIKLSKGEI